MDSVVAAKHSSDEYSLLIMDFSFMYLSGIMPTEAAYFGRYSVGKLSRLGGVCVGPL